MSDKNTLEPTVLQKSHLIKSMSGMIQFYSPSLQFSDDSITIKNEETGFTYYATKGSNQLNPNKEEDALEYQGFPFVVSADGSLWNHAILFLLWKIKKKFKISSDRLNQYANVLQDFKRFCERENIDYLVAARKWTRPNWKYRHYLESNKAKQLGNKMKSLSAFFDYLIKEQGIQYAADLWTEEEGSMLIFTENGGAFTKNYVKRDVDFEAKTQNQHDGHIRDGEKMRPMTQDEQHIFDEVMSEHSNTELFLSSMIALNTAARKQTVFTLRLHHFVESLPESYDANTVEGWLDQYRTISDHSEKTLKVGYGTDADTKNSKQFLLYFPGWLYKALVFYIISERGKNRRDGAFSQNHDLDQYLFLTRNSRPYYHAKGDINLKKYAKIEKGNAINLAMVRFREELYSKCVDLKKSKFPVRFHDFRATYGMNYLDANESLVDSGELTWSNVINGLAKRMAHEDIASTQKYLDFKRFTKLKPKIQTAYEESRMKAIYERINYH